MPKYKVRVTEEIIRRQTFIVEAPDKYLAIKKALGEDGEHVEADDFEDTHAGYVQNDDVEEVTDDAT